MAGVSVYSSSEATGSPRCKLRSMVECFLDMVRRDPTKERLQLVKIRIASQRSMRLFCSGDLMFMGVVECLDVQKGIGRELMDMVDTMINKIFKFVIRRTHDGLGELRSDSLVCRWQLVLPVG